MKKICLLLSLLMALSLFAGCGGTTTSPSGSNSPASVASTNEPAPVETPEPSSEPVSIRILTRLSSNQPNAVAFRDRVQQFRDQNPNITIEDLSIEDEASWESKFKTAVASGDVPELFATYGGASFVNYAQTGVALDLTNALNADPAWRDGFLDVFENFQFEEVPGTYAVPYEFYAIALFYNKDLFAQIGAEPPKTIEEFEEVADKFIAQGIVPMALGEKDVWRGGHFFCNLIDKGLGAAANNELGAHTRKYTDPDVVSLFTLMSDWNKKGYFGEKPVTYDHDAEKAMFHSGQSAMHINGSWYVPEASASEIADKISVVPFPSFGSAPENANVWMGGSGGAFALSGQADPGKQAAAIELLKYVTNIEAFEYYQKVQNGGVFPAKIESDPSVVDRLTVEYSALLSTGTFKSEVQNYDKLPQMQDKIRNEIQGMFAGESPERTAANIQEEIDKNS